jgi:hypothetical protein
MAEFNNLITTSKGQALFADAIANNKTIKFISVKTSETIYQENQILTLEQLENPKQTVEIARISKLNDTQIEIEAVIQNTEITEGYMINTIGLYAKINEEDSEEVLYAVASISEEGKGAYLPPFNNITVAGMNFKINVNVSSTTNVDFTVNPATPVTHQDFINFINNSRNTYK